MTKKEYIRRYIHLKIQAGEWKPGEKIMSENQMAIKFECSRITVRQAIMPFVYSGTIVSIKGKGYVISEDNLRFSLRAQSESHNITHAKLDPIENPSKEIIDLLEVEKDENGIYFTKTYYSNKMIISKQITCLNKDVLWEAKYDGFEKSITNELAKQGVVIKNNEVSIKFSNLDILKKTAKELNWGDEFLVEQVKSSVEGKWLEKTARITNKKVFEVKFMKIKSF